MTDFPWKISRNGVEIVFPEGARRFVEVSVRQIPTEGSVRRYIDGAAAWTGDGAFRLHAVELSCSDQTQAPVMDLWPGQEVRVELPTEFSVPGPTAELAHTPVAGSVVGVNAQDETVGTQATSSRTVSIPGAVAIRYRPRLDCVVTDRQSNSGQWRGNGGWSISLEELSGGEDSDVENFDWIQVAPLPAQVVDAGQPLSIDIAELVNTNTGKPVEYWIDTHMPGLSVNQNTGQLNWTSVPPGVHAIAVEVASGAANTTQTFAVLGETEGGAVEYPIMTVPGAEQWTEAGGRLMRGAKIDSSQNVIVNRAGYFRVVLIGGGGPGRSQNPGGGGSAGGFVDAVLWLDAGIYVVVVGAGGSPGAPGTETSAFGLVAVGGLPAVSANGAALADGSFGGGSFVVQYSGGGAGFSGNGISGRGSSSEGMSGSGGSGTTARICNRTISACGGGGGGKNSSGAAGIGSNGGGGGAGAYTPPADGQASTGSGGGGGGLGRKTGGNGGSGCVYVEWQVG